ncbi:hypothetical protein D3C87_96000 [compost metagenome]
MSSLEEEFNPSLAMQLIRNLWIETDRCQKPIGNIGHWFFEISKGGVPKESIINQWEKLLEAGIVEPVSEEPPSWQFTEKGKRIETEKDLTDAITSPER